jgi:hypothetical protein
MESHELVTSPQHGDLLSYIGTIGGFVGLVATIKVFLLGSSTSLVSPGVIDVLFFGGYLRQLLDRIMSVDIATLMKRKQIKKSDDDVSYCVVNGGHRELRSA